MLKLLIIATAVFGFAAPARASTQNEHFWGSSTRQLRGNLKVAERVANVPIRIRSLRLAISTRYFPNGIARKEELETDFLTITSRS
jgi:hypothetical protein